MIFIAFLSFACQQNTTDNVVIKQENEKANSQQQESKVKYIKESDQLADMSAGAAVKQHQMHKRMAESQAVLSATDEFAYYAPAPLPIRMPVESTNRENYKHFDNNPVKRVFEDPVSTFSIDVDTGSYANVRRMLNQGVLPPKDAVRAEELINYFDYDFVAPNDLSKPFNVSWEIAPTPWNKHTHLLQIGVKAYEADKNQLPNANLVFLVDVSGSMNSENKLGLLKKSLNLLTHQLGKDDRIALVVYAGASGVVLQPTSGDQKALISNAINQLSAGGSTNGASGIRLAYDMAQQGFIKDGINRVLLATDGDFNVGTVNHEQLMDLIEEKRKTGIALSTLGFGTGNYNDHLMEQLADQGNGNYSYIDTLNEARKVLVDERHSTLLTVANDVKLQIEFNPEQIAEYRLIGYENRHLDREDFNNDKVDAGDIGAGHSVTALYEITLADSNFRRIDDLRYQTETKTKKSKSSELAFLKMRYKSDANAKSELLEWAIEQSDIQQNIQKSSENLRFAAAVAAFAQQLRGGEYLDQFDYEDIRKLANTARGDDPFGYRGEFISLLGMTQSIGELLSQSSSPQNKLH